MTSARFGDRPKLALWVYALNWVSKAIVAEKLVIFYSEFCQIGYEFIESGRDLIDCHLELSRDWCDNRATKGNAHLNKHAAV